MSLDAYSQHTHTSNQCNYRVRFERVRLNRFEVRVGVVAAVQNKMQKGSRHTPVRLPSQPNPSFLPPSPLPHSVLRPVTVTHFPVSSRPLILHQQTIQPLVIRPLPSYSQFLLASVP